MALLRKLSFNVNRICEVTLFSLMVFMVGLTMAQIVCRVFFQALVWSEELVRFSLVAASLVGASVAFYRGSHISISFLTDRLPSGLRLAVQVAMRLGAVAFFVVVAWYGWILMGTESFQTTPALGISMRWVYAMYPLFGAVVILHLLAGFADLMGGER
ncbi:TRAP transporter small permease [Dethiosulfovibrio salsuginis]|uniref:TRAP-type C4-dicarboxylate transport system, small permease component n=1 Tax=Dethiosulfovibrio salsuginis TaxID=561720 RepID=A0A1X7J1Q6_9BACT|nr:TRAP transporter small permease [Dethiosulfovibrio salsuginis]SMG21108.1 TRAP-type C4-dicarboxylate transport system, small permease component [Dethiosulfovibrio salsuginis]